VTGNHKSSKGLGVKWAIRMQLLFHTHTHTHNFDTELFLCYLLFIVSRRPLPPLISTEELFDRILHSLEISFYFVGGYDDELGFVFGICEFERSDVDETIGCKVIPADFLMRID
jgi:hypothetical protein